MSTPERIEAATRKKEEGNQLFKIGKYQRAAKKYEKVCQAIFGSILNKIAVESFYLFFSANQAVDYVSQDVPYTDGDEKIIKPLTISCWSNGAACCLKLNNFREAIDLCSKVMIPSTCLTQINHLTEIKSMSHLALVTTFKH